jgi:cyclophilin family peptidyl-prolyl cis-trans isomerase/protein-disulfide isomerase
LSVPRLGPTSTSRLSNPSPTGTIPITPSPAATQIPPIEWSRGRADAPVVLVEYGDFQGEGSYLLAPILALLLEDHPEDLRLVFRPYPLWSLHDKAFLAGQAAQAAGAQGRFWEMHDLLFGRWQDWVDLTPEAFLGWLVNAAEELGMEPDRFRQAIESGEFADEMQQAINHAAAAGLPGTPVLYLNGTLFGTTPSLVNLEAAIRLELLASEQFDAYPPLTIDPEATYIAHLRFNLGEVSVQLYADVAPLAVNSFIFLAESGWYNGNSVYRVVPGMLVETGDPSSTGLGGPGYFFETEVDALVDFDSPGMVAMSIASPDTNGSRFFISLAPLHQLDGTRSIFGRVLEGLDLLQVLEARDALTDILDPPQATLIEVEIERR